MEHDGETTDDATVLEFRARQKIITQHTIVLHTKNENWRQYAILSDTIFLFLNKHNKQ